MIKNNVLSLIVAIILYLLAILLYALEPVKFLYDYDCIIFDPNILCIIVTMISFSFIVKGLQIKKIRFLYIVLFLMTYLALIIGNNNVFDFVLKRMISHYVERTNIFSENYEKLWNIWSNDLSRNLMYIFAIPYSLLATFVFFILRRLKEKQRQKKRTDNYTK